MRIQRLEVSSFPVPFRAVFRHASASRAQAENLIVAAYSDCGKVGYGEGCPRRYVTGETVEERSRIHPQIRRLDHRQRDRRPEPAGVGLRLPVRSSTRTRRPTVR